MLPTLSQLQAWDTEHLVDAAHYWSRTADLWEDVFLQVRNQSHTIVWDGAGGEALRARTGGDLVIVTAKADQLRQAAVIAREGAGTIGAAQRRVIYAVQDANDAGFNVGEDLSSPTPEPAAPPQNRHLVRHKHKLSPPTSANAPRSSSGPNTKQAPRSPLRRPELPPLAFRRPPTTTNLASRPSTTPGNKSRHRRSRRCRVSKLPLG
ncbi:hypothetical protein LAUMK41_03180 [Mycobacterium attenuatum]|nr:hypothetical protein LAUMK41_03180 [Mycobacterium attenuatum]